MFGLFAVFGRITRGFTKERIYELWVPNSRMSIVSNDTNFTIARFVPEKHPDHPTLHASRDGKLHLAIDGYVIAESAQERSGLQPQVDSLIESFRSKGIAAGLDELVAGSYVMTAVDTVSQTAHVITDPIASLTIYKSKVENGWLVSTNPVALARTGLIDTSPDMTACAEWALFAYAIGERYPVKGIRTLAPGTVFSIDLRSGDAERKKAKRFWEIPLGDESPTVEQTSEAFRRACSRLRVIDRDPAHLQSSGMDSRLISASMPDGFNPSCYTYGDPDAHEIRIARMVAEKRGSPWFHTWQHGDEIAEDADSIFGESGIIMWPDRRFAARKIASDHHAGLLDGLCGDVMIGGSYYGHDKYFGSNRTLHRILARPCDTGYSRFSMDRIVEAIYDDILQVRDPGYFGNFLNEESISSIYKEKKNIQQDIRECIQDSKPGIDSMALLWRNFLISTRASHYTVQQGITCKKFVNVYYPFTNDLEFSRMAMSIHPKDSMYRRYYIRLYKRCFPGYAQIPYGDTLIPIRRPALNHKLSAILLSKNVSIPFLTGSHNGRVRDPNGWGIWLEESGKLRDYVRSSLDDAGMLDKSRADMYFGDIASGKINGGGKLFHLASVAKWRTVSTAISSGRFRHE